MTASLAGWLYVISSVLLAPVLLALLALLGWTFMLLGGFLREALSRRSGPASAGLLRRFEERVRGRTDDRDVVGKALVDLENDVAASLAALSFATRVAPMLGLMGTLIPLGPALTGLAQGDTAELARNLVVAFTATVVGLLASGATYGMGLARRTWYARDLADLEHAHRFALEARSS